jgi:glycosyltransferase involved in cell wall biosynthesis
MIQGPPADDFMTILYHHRTLADGAEGIHITEMVEAFEALGHTVVMLALAKPAQRGVGRRSALSAIKSAAPTAFFELAAIALNVVDLVTTLLAIRRHRPQLVYKRHALYDVGVGFACRIASVPFVLEVNAAYSSADHQRFEHVSFPSVAKLCERWMFRKAALVATVSTPLGNHIRQIGGADVNVLVVPNGANPDRFMPAVAPPELRRHLSPPGRLVVGWVGILRSWHRVDLLMEAAAGLEHVQLVIIGDGPDRERLLEAARRFGVEERVHMTGRVPHAEMPRYIAALDVAAAADDRTGYASPMKLLEYMAMGKPVVAPRMQNIEDFIADGVNGLLFEPRNAIDLAKCLERLHADEVLRTRIGANARQSIVDKRNWKAIASTILARVAPSSQAGPLST